MSADCRLHRHQDQRSDQSSLLQECELQQAGAWKEIIWPVRWRGLSDQLIELMDGHNSHIAFFLSFYSHMVFTQCTKEGPFLSQIRPWNKDFRGSTPRNHAVNPHSDIEMRPELFPSGRQRLAVWHRHHFMWRLLLPQPAAAFHVRSSLCQQLCTRPAVEPCSAALS